MQINKKNKTKKKRKKKESPHEPWELEMLLLKEMIFGEKNIKGLHQGSSVTAHIHMSTSNITRKITGRLRKYTSKETNRRTNGVQKNLRRTLTTAIEGWSLPPNQPTNEYQMTFNPCKNVKLKEKKSKQQRPLSKKKNTNKQQPNNQHSTTNIQQPTTALGILQSQTNEK
eukprot:m.56402 g.56402  ORF g.56402 m.56402 type:complete len:170 (+) comp13012_c1_seq1:77-586(+)